MEEDIGDVVCLERTEIGHTDYTKTGERDVDSTSTFEFKTSRFPEVVLKAVFGVALRRSVRSTPRVHRRLVEVPSRLKDRN